MLLLAEAGGRIRLAALVPFGVLLVASFSHGVLRARTVRFGIVAVLLAALVAVVVGGDIEDVVELVVSVTQLGCLVWFARTPGSCGNAAAPVGGPSLAPLMAIAVLVGILGGVIGADTSRTGLRGRSGDRAVFERRSAA